MTAQKRKRANFKNLKSKHRAITLDLPCHWQVHYMYGAQFNQQVRAGQCILRNTKTAACSHTIMASSLAERHPQIVCMACRQVRNLARYARGGYNPDTRVDVIISVMVQITFRVCFGPVVAAAALRTPLHALVSCQLLRPQRAFLVCWLPWKSFGTFSAIWPGHCGCVVS